MVNDWETLVGTEAEMGVAIVAYNAHDYIAECLSSLFQSRGATLRVVVVDNASSDATCAAIVDWAEQHSDTVRFEDRPLGKGQRAEADLTLLRSPYNGGFAFGTNRGLEALLADDQLKLFWILNPDCVAMPGTAAALIKAAQFAPFALMGGRALYAEDPGRVQSDGGRFSRWTGVCSLVNAAARHGFAPHPSGDEVDFISGAHCVASREFIEAAGLMKEDFFLYYEEVEWASRRGSLPLRLVAGATVLHRGGASIGSGSLKRPSSAFADYFNHRSRTRFVRSSSPTMIPITVGYGLLRSAALFLKGRSSEAGATLTGTLDLKPPKAVRDRLDSNAQRIAFG